MKARYLLLMLFGLILTGSSVLIPRAETAAQDDSFPFGANTAFCEPGYFGPFEGCSPWEGVTVSFVSADEAVNGSCVTAVESPDQRTASCRFDVPYSSTMTVSIDETAIPEGYYLESEPVQAWPIADGPPEGVFGVPAFVLLPLAEETPSDDQGSVAGGDAVAELPNTGSGTRSGSSTNDLAFASMIAAFAVLAGLQTGLSRRSRR